MSLYIGASGSYEEEQEPVCPLISDYDEFNNLFAKLYWLYYSQLSLFREEAIMERVYCVRSVNKCASLKSSSSSSEREQDIGKIQPIIKPSICRSDGVALRKEGRKRGGHAEYDMMAIEWKLQKRKSH